MRNLMLLAMLAAPLAQAETLEVASNSMLRLPDKSASVHFTHLRVADAATLLLPASLAQLTVDQLELGRDARIAIAQLQQIQEAERLLAQVEADQPRLVSR